MALTRDNYEHIKQVLYQRAAIVLNGDKHYLVESRLLPIARRAGLNTVNELIDRVRVFNSTPVIQEIIDAMTTNETSFFRDGTPFEILKKTVFPELIERRRALKTIRCWSAGCSSGQEPYSLAMLWQDAFGHLTEWQFRVLATDISSLMLERAKQGMFSDVEVNRGIPPNFRTRFFRESSGQWCIDSTLRAFIEFRLLNLIDVWPSPMKADVIFLRNVLVYFDVPTKQMIFNRLRQVLAHDGYLFLGGAETTLMLDDAFERVAVDGGSYYRLKP